MSMRKNLGRYLKVALLLAIPPLTQAESPRLGVPASAAEVATRSMNVFPDGQGLPDGRGTAVEGKPIYESRCASCHGPSGTGGSAEELAGGRLSEPSPDKTIGTYWPYATTIFDFVRRSMPLDVPGTLSNDQVYAVTAYLLNINGIIGEREEVNGKTLPQVKMPNRNGFVSIDTRKALR